METHPESIEASIKKYRATDGYREINRLNSQRYKRRYPEKIKAQKLAERNVPIGAYCIKCGAIDNLERHHEDYSKPLEVVTLCDRCHKGVHNQ